MIMINSILFLLPQFIVRLIIQAGIDVFIRKDYNQIIVESWKYCQENKGLEVYGWCIMPGHVHMIIGIKKKLEDIVRDTKSYT